MKNEEYQMTMSEFKGATIQALGDIKDRLTAIEASQQNLQNQINSQNVRAGIMGAVAGIISAILNPFGKNV